MKFLYGNIRRNVSINVYSEFDLPVLFIFIGKVTVGTEVLSFGALFFFLLK